MGIMFNDATVGLLDGKNFAVLATTNPDGSPQSSVIWVRRDGDDGVVLSTLRGRRKESNIRRDDRVSLSIFEVGNPYNYVEIRGTADIAEEGGRALIDELANKYRGHDYPADAEGAVRVRIRIQAERITGFSA
ncbi:MAG: PPOX class F420-dependent enzyme [Pseudonocardia sp. SCN 72-86]|nr:MAG: PPOX class F420-dependent enzyme [Pseudonocardia sp. SCN 72-86]